MTFNSKDRRLALGALAMAVTLAAIILTRGVGSRPRGIPIRLVPIQRSQPQEQELELAGADEIEGRFATGREEDPFERERWFWEQRAFPLRTVPAEVHRSAIQAESARTSWSLSGAEAANWVNLGPAPVRNITYGGSSSQDASGRALTVAIHPSNPNILLLGTAQGGIWKSTDGGASFSAVGDNLDSLAIKVIRFAPSNPSIVYAGSGEPHGSSSIFGAGLYKSTDAGSTWQPLPPNGAGRDFRYLAITGLQVDPANADVVYATTADIASALNPFQPPATSRQTGIWKSTNGGQTWTLLKAATPRTAFPSHLQGNVGFMDLESGGPNAPQLLYATEYLGGIYKSTDAGATWNLMTPVKAQGGAALPAPVPDFTYYYEGRFFLLSRCGLRDDLPEFSRIEIGVSARNPNVIYAGYAVEALLLDASAAGNCADPNQVILASVGLLFKSIDGGQTWAWLGDWGRGGAPEYCAEQCSYDNLVVVNPNNENDVIIGGNANYNELWPDPIDNPTRLLSLPWRGMLYRSLDGGNSWIDTTQHYVSIGNTPVGTFQGLDIYKYAAVDTSHVIHPDQHAAAFDPSGSIYVTNDGGLYRATVTGAGTNGLDYRWDNLNNGISTLQFYYFDAHPSNPNIILGGMQDNACGYYNGSFWDGWCFGDGTLGAFDPVDPRHVYMGTQFSVHRHDNGGTKVALDPDGNPANGWHLQIFSNQVVTGGERVGFIPVFEIDPVQSNIVYGAAIAQTDAGQPVGGLYRSTNRGDTWSRVSAVDAFQTEGWPTSISVSPANHNLVWVGTSTGKVYLFDFNRSQISSRSTNLPGRHVTKVEASPVDANTVYVAFSGYNVNTPATPGKVFKSQNQGQSWRDVSGNLPDVPVSALALDPRNASRLWVGSDVGVFVTSNGGATWTSSRNNMPIVAIMDLKYNPTTGYLMAATHGRGLWRLQPGSSVAAQRVRLPILLRNTRPQRPTPTPTAGATTPSPTATATATKTPTPSATPTATASPVAIKNGDFELGSNGDWAEYSLNDAPLIVNADLPLTPRSGQWVAWLGGLDDEISVLAQMVTLPAGGPIYLRYYYHIASEESFDCNADFAGVLVDSTIVWQEVLCQATATSGWTAGTVDLSGYAGQTIEIEFRVETDVLFSSDLFLDDVALRSTP